LLLKPLFYVCEPLAEFSIRQFESRFRLDLQMTSYVRHCEKHIANLLPHFGMVGFRL
jgi:hypothetical protein